MKKLSLVLLAILMIGSVMAYNDAGTSLNFAKKIASTNYSLINVNNSNFLEGHASSYFYQASNPSGFITDGNTGWDNSYGFITTWVETDPICVANYYNKSITDANDSLRIPYSGATSNVDLNNKSLANISSINGNTLFGTTAGVGTTLVNGTSGWITIGATSSTPNAFTISGNQQIVIGGTATAVGENYGKFGWRFSSSLGTASAYIAGSRTNAFASGDGDINFYIVNRGAVQKVLSLGNYETSFMNNSFSVAKNVTIGTGSSWVNYGACYLTAGMLGHCTKAVNSTGGCTCASN